MTIFVRILTHPKDVQQCLWFTELQRWLMGFRRLGLLGSERRPEQEREDLPGSPRLSICFREWLRQCGYAQSVCYFYAQEVPKLWRYVIIHKLACAASQSMYYRCHALGR
jgi:hypothetical protein